LITIALLVCSINLSASNAHILSTGGITRDSVTVSVSDLRKAVIKMTELKYLKQIDAKKDSIIANDSIQIEHYKTVAKEYKTQRNILSIVGGGLLATLIILLFK